MYEDIINNVFFSAHPTGSVQGSDDEKNTPTYVLRRIVARLNVALMIPLRQHRRAGATVDGHTIFLFRKGGTRPSK